MFSFFKRTPKIFLDCFIIDSSIHEYTPIVRASQALPEWWKKLPRNKIEYNFATEDYPSSNITMKHCYGFLELYKRGVILESWCDVAVKTTDKNVEFFNSNGEKPISHLRHQWGESFKNYQHLKLISPWIFKEKTGEHFLFMGAEWSLEAYNFKVVPGVVNYDWNTGTNVNLMIPNNTQFEIPMGQPLAHIIPLSNKELVVKNHLVDSFEYSKVTKISARSFYGWKTIKKLNDRNKERKCPFHG